MIILLKGSKDSTHACRKNHFGRLHANVWQSSIFGRDLYPFCLTNDRLRINIIRLRSAYRPSPYDLSLGLLKNRLITKT